MIDPLLFIQYLTIHSQSETNQPLTLKFKQSPLRCEIVSSYTRIHSLSSTKLDQSFIPLVG